MLVLTTAKVGILRALIAFLKYLENKIEGVNSDNKSIATKEFYNCRRIPHKCIVTSTNSHAYALPLATSNYAYSVSVV